jgi:hypothetical protein
VQNKPLLFGLLAGAIGLWLLLSWDPVAREELEDDASTEIEPAPEPAPPAATPPPVQQPQQAEAPTHEPEPAPEEPAAEAPVGDTPSGIKLVQASREELDRANLPPPSPNGPLEELKKEFESSARDASSAELEAKIQDVFKLEHVPPELLESAVCQGNTCRVRTRWTPQRAGGFTLALTKLAIKMVAKEGEEPIFDRSFAVGEAGERNSNGERSIDVYVRKRPGATP